MPDFRVSYLIHGGSISESEIRVYIEEELDGQDLVIERVTPEAVEGWYQRSDEVGTLNGRCAVLYWTVDEIEDYSADSFYEQYTRMKTPEVYEG